jgi:hypothetical protein
MTDEQVQALLRTLRHQFAARLAALPLDDEEETDEERAAMEVALADLAAGRVVPWSKLRPRYL